MGFWKIFGRLLLFEESKSYFPIIRENAVNFIISSLKSDSVSQPRFGFEFEFHKISISHSNKKVQLDLTGQDDINKAIASNMSTGYQLAHEYGGWMIEVIHDKPFQFTNASALVDNVFQLYSYLNSAIGEEKILSFPSFPLLGVGDTYFKEESNCMTLSTANEEEEIEDDDDNSQNTISNSSKYNNSFEKSESQGNPYSESQFIHDVIINKHPRFGNLTRNIRLRRNKKVNIQIPIFKDTFTNTEPTKDEPYPGKIYMDAMAFGMGNCCIQVTLGASSLDNATYLYDQLLPLTPILLALSSTCPVYKGKLSDIDNRFPIICQSVDDRTEEELNEKNTNYIYTSRYSPAYSYISEHKYSHCFNNDAPSFPINKDYYNQFIKHGIGEKLSLHFSNLLVRDPLVIFSDKIEISDPNDITHFECINSTNWNSLRFKLPRPSDNDNCFKIEVRPCDLQMTPYENISMISLILSLYGAIMKYDVNFIIPITKVNENFNRAYTNDAVNKQKFYWRINGITEDTNTNKNTKHELDKFKPCEPGKPEPLTYKDDQDNIKELTINEILNGCERYHYPGVLSVVKKALKEFFNTSDFTDYIEFISKRASGELWTGAKYIRKYISESKLYKRDSVVSEELNYDLICLIQDIQNGKCKPKEMFG